MVEVEVVKKSDITIKDNEIKKLLNNGKNNSVATNIFPKLMSKEKKNTSTKEKITKFKARPIRTKVDSIIYDSIEGKKVYEWESGRSIT